MTSFDPLAAVARPNVKPLPGQALPAKWTSERPVERSADLRRVLALPRRPSLESEGSRAAELQEAAAARWRRPLGGACACAEIDPTRGECITELNAVQGFGLHDISIGGGLAGKIGGGVGKTILGLMAPMALADHGVQTSLLLIPPKRDEELVTTYRLLAEHWEVPSIRVDSQSYQATIPGRPRLVVLPYSRLSHKGFTAYLENLRPDAIIADEAHRLRNTTSAARKRVERYLTEHPWCRFLWWTATASDGKLEHYLHLMRWALGERSPLPLLDDVGQDWGRVVDARRISAPAGALFDLCEPGEHVRDGLRRRMNETLGVVATSVPSSDVPVTIEAREAPDIPDAVAVALDRVRELWVRPDGEELVDAREVAAVARDVACGYYLWWDFVNGETDAMIDAWLEARREWRKELRRKVQCADVYLDSPSLCEDAAERYHGRRPGEGPQWASQYWPEWDRVRRTVKPITRVAWIDDYLARDAARWALDEGGVVWYARTAFGERVAEVGDLPLYGGGPKATRALAQADASRGAVVSLKAHSVGTDGMQRKWCAQLMAQHEAGNTSWEQTICRLARQGQRRPVWTGFYNHTDELAAAFAEARLRADAVTALDGATQKLSAALGDLTAAGVIGTE